MQTKVSTEKLLQSVASSSFKIICLRFATACGWSPRLRLDLVLNDFVASAVEKGNIKILSDGTPWRPLIHVKDMARAIEWALINENNAEFTAINIGSDKWNYQVRELAVVVARTIPGTTVETNQEASSDSRSYKVDFSLFERIAPGFQPEITLESAVKGLKEGLERLNYKQYPEISKHLVRLNTLNEHIYQKEIIN